MNLQYCYEEEEEMPMEATPPSLCSRSTSIKIAPRRRTREAAATAADSGDFRNIFESLCNGVSVMGSTTTECAAAANPI